MNKSQELVINLLSHAIRGQKYELDINENINWNEVIEEANEHSVKGLIYTAINNTDYTKTMDKETLDDLKKTTFFSGMYQINHIKQVSKVLDELNKEAIQVVALKGLIVRELYPKPEQRTMGDADLIVKEGDLNKVRLILETLGYTVSDREYHHHIRFKHKNHLDIEVHWVLGNGRFFDSIDSIEDNIWETCIPVNIGVSNALSLSLEDMTLHLITHMVNHIKDAGFGIRQLCDLVVLVEKQGHLIDWSLFNKKVKECNIIKFTSVIFNICNKLFNMEIPSEIYIESIDEENMNIFIDEIFSNGVFGKRHTHKQYANWSACNIDREEPKNVYFKKVFYTMFGPIDTWGDKYNYAKKNKILIPIAYIHKFLYGLFGNKFTLKEKFNLIFKTTKESKNKDEILKWLELQ
ncbi:nucleotidyltransferase domain-containing protein [Romboutsia lituseburensis]|uniref:Uncharacterized nucleotidyltransferase n=1 Tax=Romboutsia lituseburensis DSM 797 TaxID=1121325 RepID=A0A1G9PI79_9FIRM|nr:nucleotidyltransferase family protein [Romboutsia lituseburensis]CEH33402.1 Conserved domain protein [Romboutsia lituseburensis]SDL98546.1 Uncharacterised nucleotidyltransferase [Romboutsia lituseburensis DSM 797]